MQSTSIRYPTRYRLLLLFGSRYYFKLVYSITLRTTNTLTGQYIHPQENGEWIYPHTEDVFKQAGLESIECYIEKRRAQVANHLSPESKAITDIANSLEIEINMEKVCWW